MIIYQDTRPYFTEIAESLLRANAKDVLWGSTIKPGSVKSIVSRPLGIKEKRQLGNLWGIREVFARRMHSVDQEALKEFVLKNYLQHANYLPQPFDYDIFIALLTRAVPTNVPGSVAWFASLGAEPQDITMIEKTLYAEVSIRRPAHRRSRFHVVPPPENNDET